MKATDADLREALRQSGPRPVAGRPACPSPEVLARIAIAEEATGPEGAARGADETTLQHLAECADCALEYRLALSLRPWAEGAAAALARPAARPTPRRLGRFVPQALAASVVIGLGLGGWATTERRHGRALQARLAERERQDRAGETEAVRPRPDLPAAGAARLPSGLGQPEAGIPLVDLFPRDAGRGQVGTSAVVEVPSDVPFLVLILNLREPSPRTAYAIEIRDAGDGLVWAGEGARQGDQALTLAVPSQLLSGEYRIQLFGAAGSRRLRLEEYSLGVHRAPERSSPPAR